MHPIAWEASRCFCAFIVPEIGLWGYILTCGKCLGRGDKFIHPHRGDNSIALTVYAAKIASGVNLGVGYNFGFSAEAVKIVDNNGKRGVAVSLFGTVACSSGKIENLKKCLVIA